jgi:hypothetical protein
MRTSRLQTDRKSGGEWRCGDVVSHRIPIAGSTGLIQLRSARQTCCVRGTLVQASRERPFSLGSVDGPFASSRVIDSPPCDHVESPVMAGLV